MCKILIASKLSVAFLNHCKSRSFENSITIRIYFSQQLCKQLSVSFVYISSINFEAIQKLIIHYRKYSDMKQWKYFFRITFIDSWIFCHLRLFRRLLYNQKKSDFSLMHRFVPSKVFRRIYLRSIIEYQNMTKSLNVVYVGKKRKIIPTHCVGVWTENLLRQSSFVYKVRRKG